MLRKVVCALFMLALCVGITLADDLRTRITKVDGDKVTFTEIKGKDKGPEKTLPVADNVKVLKGIWNKEKMKLDPGDPLEGGLKNELFTKLGDKGIGARIMTDADNKKITEIRVFLTEKAPDQPAKKDADKKENKETDQPTKDADKKGLEELEGNWTAVSIEVKGKKQPDEAIKNMKLTVKGDQWSVSGEGDRKGMATFKIDPSKSPKTIDITNKRQNKEVLSRGIYKVEGDTLTVCRTEGDLERPKEFKTTKDAAILAVWKRASK